MSAKYAKAWADFHAEYGPDIDEAVFQAGWIMRGVADRAVIENAPHAWDCTDPDGGSFCTCWKANA